MSWAETHWKRLVALLLFLAVLGVAALLGIVSLGMSFVRNSDVAEEAIARARSSQAVTQRLGVPIKEARFVSGSINVSPGSGSADLALPISGPKGSGTLYVTARKIAGAWQYSLIQLNVEGSGDKIDVLNADLPSGAVPRTPEPPPSSATPSQF